MAPVHDCVGGRARRAGFHHAASWRALRAPAGPLAAGCPRQGPAMLLHPGAGAVHPRRADRPVRGRGEVREQPQPLGRVRAPARAAEHPERPAAAEQPAADPWGPEARERDVVRRRAAGVGRRLEAHRPGRRADVRPAGRHARRRLLHADLRRPGAGPRGRHGRAPAGLEAPGHLGRRGHGPRDGAPQAPPVGQVRGAVRRRRGGRRAALHGVAVGGAFAGAHPQRPQGGVPRARGAPAEQHAGAGARLPELPRGAAGAARPAFHRAAGAPGRRAPDPGAGAAGPLEAQAADGLPALPGAAQAGAGGAGAEGPEAAPGGAPPLEAAPAGGRRGARQLEEARGGAARGGGPGWRRREGSGSPVTRRHRSARHDPKCRHVPCYASSG
mmetsp:Transcript_7141/g.19908  ORF Transcript_7141/g.19908 Transcript_7141/m.19908 type:complete len:385 (+) Transcript_7141:548-1702(+)